MRRCSLCHKSGHYKKTCPDNSNRKAPTPQIISRRRCTRCNQIGHNRRRCTTNLDELPEGHKLRLEQKQGVDRLEDENGILPEKGLWLIHKGKKKIAGKILYVKKNGIIVWEDIYGTHVESKQETILSSGYEYTDLTPKHLDWNTTYVR